MEKNIYDNMVKRTVTYSFGIWFVLLVLALGWLYIQHGNYRELQLEQESLTETIQKIGKIEKEGMSFHEYKKIKKDFKKDKNLETIVNFLEKDFYDVSFKNSGEEYSKYDDFIKNKIKEIEERVTSDEQERMDSISNTVLPSFSLYNLGFNGDEAFNELRFINYVETIMQSFNLEYIGDIGISDVFPVEVPDKEKAKKSEKTNEELLSNKIFYIPLTFTISGNKASIIDFIYFIEKVGNVNVASETLDIYKDTFFKKGDKNFRNSDMVLEGDTRVANYNPYLNQLIDIESIAFENLIYEKKDGDVSGEFISNIRKIPQGLEEFKAEVTLRFYVKGVSDYKIEEKYNNTIDAIISYGEDIENGLKALGGLSIKEKTPGVALLIKRLVTYKKVLSQLEANRKKYKELSVEAIYKDIVTSLDIKKMLEGDLTGMSSITGLHLKGGKFGEDRGE